MAQDKRIKNIYLDTSVCLAYLLAEDTYPPKELWHHRLLSSRLLEYEVWNRILSYELLNSHEEATFDLLSRVSFFELSPIVLKRAKETFPISVRTLDSLHLSTLDYVWQQGMEIELATYDEKMLEAAKKMNFKVTELSL